MPFKDIVLLIIGSLGTLGILAAGLGYFISSFRKGSTQEKDSLISSSEQLNQFYKDQAEGYKIMMETKDTKNAESINDLSRQVGELRGQLNAETQQKKEYLEILQNRDPETKKFMEFMIASVTSQSAINQEIVKMIKEIYQMITDEHQKELHLDGTLTKK